MAAHPHRRSRAQVGRAITLGLLLAAALFLGFTLGRGRDLTSALKSSSRLSQAQQHAASTADCSKEAAAAEKAAAAERRQGGGSGGDTARAGGAAAAQQQAGSSAGHDAQDAPEVVAAAAVGLSRIAPVLGPNSAKWAPLIVSTCTKDMPRHWAPCMVGTPDNPTLVHGEELIYPPFSIPQPGFLTEEHGEWWRKVVPPYEPRRFWLREGRGVFPTQFGQNLVMHNVKYSNNPSYDTWNPNSCMFQETNHRNLPPLGEGVEPRWKERAVFAGTPMSFIIQHFLDRVCKVLVQTEGWRALNGTHIMTGAQPHSNHVIDLWKILKQQPAQQQVEHLSTDVSLAEVVFPCRTPLIHPFFNERLREIVGMPEATPLSERKHVLYLSRNQDSGGNGGERRVTNEAAVLEAVRDVLQERGRGEELVMFNQHNFATVRDLAEYFHRNVSAVMGPHGGAWYNVWWAARDTFLLEFMPKSRIAVMIWEEASIIGLRYFVIPADSEPPKHNVEIDPELVKKALREQLGKTAEGPPEPQVHNEWALPAISV